MLVRSALTLFAAVSLVAAQNATTTTTTTTVAATTTTPAAADTPSTTTTDDSTTSSSSAAAASSVANVIPTSTTTATLDANGYLAQASPAYLSSVAVQFTPPANIANPPTGPLPSVTVDISAFPTGWVSPPTDSAEVQAAISTIDWTKVPSADVHTADAAGDLDMTGYDTVNDPYCWWSSTNCVTPKQTYLPPDIYHCPTVGVWGLTYDDGPIGPASAADDSWAEPVLYDFLVTNHQKADFFYIGSNLIAYPNAGQRAISQGHTICVHTWSHPPMTTQTDEQVVAELYWSIRAIKEVLGVTPKCWRPPYGDVDDRVRSIAWQMGLRTIIWDQDTNDWEMAPGGTLSPATVDSEFEDWIAARKNGSDNVSGHITLQHELSNNSVSKAMEWYPQVAAVFQVQTWEQCNGVTETYWDYNVATGVVASNATTSNSTTGSTSSSSSSSSSSSTSGATRGRS